MWLQIIIICVVLFFVIIDYYRNKALIYAYAQEKAEEKVMKLMIELFGKKRTQEIYKNNPPITKREVELLSYEAEKRWGVKVWHSG